MKDKKNKLVFIGLSLFLAILLAFKLSAKGNDFKIVIDPGHGGKDPGASSTINGNYEKDMTLDFSKKLYRKLKSEGYDVYMTREEDEYISVQDRARYSNELDPDLFISIHYNVAENKPDIEGSQVLYYPKEGSENQNDGRLLLDNLISSTDSNDMGLVPREDLVILRDTRAQAYLIELGFITNEREAKKMEGYIYNKKAIKGISNFIEDYRNKYRQ